MKQLLIFLGLIFSAVTANQIAVSSFSSGGSLQSGNIILHSSVGQQVVASVSNTNLTLSHGFLAHPLVYSLLTNDVPVMTSRDTLQVIKGNQLFYKATATDADGEKPSFRYIKLPQWLEDLDDGVLTGTAPDQADTATAGLIISDGSIADTFAIIIVIRETNDKPQITSKLALSLNEGDVLNYKLTATDPENDQLTYSMSGLPSWAVFHPENQVLSGTVAENAGNALITIDAFDGDQHDTKTLKISVTKVNNAPVFTSPANVQALEDRKFIFYPAVSDNENHQIKFSYDSFSIPQWLRVSNDSLLGTPPAEAGDAKVKLFVEEINTDEKLRDTLELTIEFVAVNDVPVFTFNPLITAEKLPPGQSIAFKATAEDEEQDDFSISIEDVSSWIQKIGPDSIFAEIDSAPFQSGKANFNDTFTVIVTETGSGNSDTQKVIISILEENFPPQVTSSLSVKAKPGLSFSYKARATDLNGSNPVINFHDVPFSLTIESDSLFGIIPPGFSAPTFFKVIASDGALADTQQVTISPDVTNEPPVFSPVGDQIARVGEQLRLSLVASDLDVELNRRDDEIRFFLEKGPEDLLLQEQTGLIVWNPSAASIGLDTLIVRVTDRSDASDYDTALITVKGPFLEVTSMVPGGSRLLHGHGFRSVLYLFSDEKIDSASIYKMAIDSTVSEADSTVYDTTLIPRISIQATRSDSITFQWETSGETLFVYFDDLFFGGEEVTLSLEKGIKSQYGETFSVDQVSNIFKIATAGDFNLDDSLNVKDVPLLVSQWEQSRAGDAGFIEIGPATGSVPFTKVTPDSVFDDKDIAVFISMWNKLALPLQLDQGLEKKGESAVDFHLAHAPSEFGRTQINITPTIGDPSVLQQLAAYRISVHITGEDLPTHSLIGQPYAPGEVFELTTKTLSHFDQTVALFNKTTPRNQLTKVSLGAADGKSVRIDYRLVDTDGIILDQGVRTIDLSVDEATAREDSSAARIITRFSFGPNPFEPAAQPDQFRFETWQKVLEQLQRDQRGIGFQLPGLSDNATISVTIRNAFNGSLVAHSGLFSNSHFENALFWSGTANNGTPVAPGVYVVKIIVSTRDGESSQYICRVGVKQ